MLKESKKIKEDMNLSELRNKFSSEDQESTMDG